MRTALRVLVASAALVLPSRGPCGADEPSPAVAALRSRFSAAEPVRTLNPLVWYHGEDETLLREELEKCREGGCGAVTVESRPHEDYLGPRWWKDLDITLRECKRLGMDVWIFDEKWFPSGIAGGLVQQGGPEFQRCFLRMDRQRVEGPRPKHAWNFRGSADIEVVLAGRWNGNVLDESSIVDLTASADIPSRTLTWDVPEGAWELMVFRVGRDEWYIDPLNPRVTDRFIEITFQPTYERYRDEFGKTIKGFFQDEPGFWNTGPGQFPWTPGFREDFRREKGYDLAKVLPALWLDLGPNDARVQFDYHDYLVRRYVRTYTGRIADWCHAKGVEFIGHVYEHWNGRTGDHWSLGTGSGHFFWVNEKLDVPSIDLVCNQVLPEGPHRPDTWGLAKLGSSAAHVYGKKNDLNLDETFGGYGWHEGLRMMKWLTDWQCVRGVNWFVPHAMNPKWPDADYPPYFWARGNNPQWPYFKPWADYANRLCDLFQAGRHVAPVALLYPAESYWSAGCPPIEETEKVLTESQWDFDLVPLDLFADPARARIETSDGKVSLRIAQEAYAAVVLPPADVIPVAVAERLREWTRAGGAAAAAGPLPTRSCEGTKDGDVKAAVAGAFPEDRRGGLAALPAVLAKVAGERADVVADPPAPALRILHRVKDGADLLFLTNEDPVAAVRTSVTVRAGGVPERWDPWTGATEPLRTWRRLPDGRTLLPVEIPPYESLLVVFAPGVEPPRVAGTSLAAVTDVGRDGDAWVVTGLADAPGAHRVTVQDGVTAAEASVDVPADPAWAAVPVEGWTLAFEGPVPVSKFRIEVAGADGRTTEADGVIPGPWSAADRGWKGRWIWSGPEEGRRRFRTTFEVPPGGGTGVLAATGDNGMEVFLNGRSVARSDNWSVPVRADVSAVLRPGVNVLAAEVVNSGGPGGFLAELRIADRDGKTARTVATGADWRVTDTTAAGSWTETDADVAGWASAAVIAAPPKGPWGDLEKPDLGASDSLPAEVRYRAELPFPAAAVILPPVRGAFTLTADGAEVAVGPDREVRLPAPARGIGIALSAKDPGDGPEGLVRVRTAPSPLPALGPWPDLGVPHYSGAATYRATVRVPVVEGFAWTLDLGEVGELAEVSVNGKPAGVRLCPPYRFDVTGRLRPGENAVEVRVTNTFANRAAAPDWKWKWGKVLPSGLLGPVRLVPGRKVTVRVSRPG